MTPVEWRVVTHLRHLFSAADCQIMMAAVMGQNCTPAELPVLVMAAVNDPRSVVRRHLAKIIKCDFDALRSKLRRATPHQLEVLLKCLNAACSIEGVELVSHDGRPSLNVLRQVGLVTPNGPVAFGLAVVRTKDFIVDQWVLRRHPHHVPATPGSVDELAREIVDLTNRLRAGNTPENVNDQMWVPSRGWLEMRVA